MARSSSPSLISGTNNDTEIFSGKHQIFTSDHMWWHKSYLQQAQESDECEQPKPLDSPRWPANAKVWFKCSIDWFIHSLIHWFIHSSIDSSIDWLIISFIHWLALPRCLQKFHWNMEIGSPRSRCYVFLYCLAYTIMCVYE